jgi:hypothetical protein
MRTYVVFMSLPPISAFDKNKLDLPTKFPQFLAMAP